MIRGAIFDLDGVLVTTDELHYHGWARLAEEEGIPFSRDVNQRQRGIGRMESLDVLLENATREYTADQRREMADRKNGYYRESLQSLTPDDALPGARDMLHALRERGILLAVGSASRNTPLIMERVDLLREVDAVVDGNDVTRSKPDPQVFLLAAERLGLEPAECLVVEDAAAGVEAAHRAGMAALGIGDRGRLPEAERLAAGLDGLTVEELLGTGSGCGPTAAQ